jgi:hypothetical protein
VNATAILSFIILAAQPLLAPPVQAADIAPCSKEQLLAFSPKPDEVETHRQFTLPFISYPFDTKMPDWGFNLIVRIDESGRVVCFQMNDIFSHKE